MSRRFTDEEISIAKTADLVSIAEHLGYTPVKIGHYYTLKEMDSMRIFDRNNWYRFSKKSENGYFCGSQIEFLEEFVGLSFRNSVSWLLDFVGYEHYIDKENERVYSSSAEAYGPNKNTNNLTVDSKSFVLPDAALENSHIYEYLNKKRCISSSVIDFFLYKGLIYESSRYSNVVFKGNDKLGKTRFASERGITDIPGKKPYKRDVAGSDKNYGFNISNDNSDTVIVFEGAIDLMSYVDIFQDFEPNMIALGMTNDKPLIRFLEEHNGIKNIILCLDNDKPGRDAVAYLTSKYKAEGYDVKECAVPTEYKDINEWLVASKLQFQSVSDNRCYTSKKGMVVFPGFRQ